jgi:hypothetical protein
MEPAVKVAIGALINSSFSLIATFISSVFIAKTYKKNRRLEFLQRRDRLSQKISDLNDRNNEAHLISARFELVAVKRAGATTARGTGRTKHGLDCNHQRNLGEYRKGNNQLG